MKVLIDHPNPFALAHGGFQIQIEQTVLSLQNLGVEVEFLRWWDASQTGDLIHYFGRPDAAYIRFAHSKGMKVVMLELLTGLGSRGSSARFLQKSLTMTAQKLLPAAFTARLAWESYRLADACLANTPWEAHLMSSMFGAASNRVHVVPNGVEPEFMNSPPRERGRWLVCTATITERKRVLELAEAAMRAQTPIWILGKAYSENDPYAQRFLQIARKNPNLIRYEGPVGDRSRLATIYREARGFVLLSSMETRSLSAEEAAACECPLLLSDLPWARTVFRQQATYCPIAGATITAPTLRRFYDAAPTLPLPSRPLGWDEVAHQLRALYESLLSTSL